MNAKRWIAIFLALVLILSFVLGVLPTVFAAESYTIGLQDSNKSNKITVTPGDTVEVYLYLKNNPGILSAGAQLNIPEGMELIGVSSALNGHNFKAIWQYSKSYDVNPYLIWVLAPTGTNSKGLVTYNGNISKITLRLSENIAEGQYTIRLTAPKDKNLTAQTSGGVIVAESNRYVSGISVANFTVTVTKCIHNWSAWTETAPVTCETDGKQMRECSLCQFKQEKITAAIGHKFAAPQIVKEPTCTQEGQKAGKCERCEKNTTEAIPATGHKMGNWISVESPTCTKQGKEKQECQNKNCDHTQTRAVEKLGHKFAAPKIVKEATCTKAGQKAGKCERCDQNTTEDIPALGHNFGQPEIIRQPTAEKTGLKQSKCSRCDEVKKEEIPCVPAETTAATTETTAETTTGVTTEAATIPEETTETTDPTEATVGTETQPVETVPQETLPDADTQEKAVLKTVLILAAVLLLGVLLTITVLAVKSGKTKE